MHDSNPAARFLLTAAFATSLTLAGCATPQSAAVNSEVERRPWDAEQMTLLTGRLARSVRDLRRAWRADPVFHGHRGAFRQNAHRLDQALRKLDRRTTQLHASVRSGAGFEETRNVARNIRVTLNDIDMKARRIKSSHWVTRKARPAMVLINEIAPFYGSGPLFDPETLQRTDRPSRRH